MLINNILKFVFTFLIILLIIIRPTQYRINDNILIAILLSNLIFYAKDLFNGKTYLYEIKRAFTDNFYVFLFGLWCLLTLIWSIFPLDTSIRSLFFLIVLLTLYFILKEKAFVYISIIIINVLVVIISIVLLLYNFGIPVWMVTPHVFRSFFPHKNTFGAYLLFTIPIIYIYYFQNPDKRKLILGCSLTFANSFFILLSYSRASILSLIFLLILIYKILIYPRYIKVLIFSSLLIILSFFLFNKEFNYILNRGSSGNLLSNRIHLWTASYKAAKNGGITGLGLGVSDQNIIINGSGSYFLESKYIREKGNGILALIEETGIVGISLFFAMILSSFVKLKNNKKLKERDLLYAVILTFIVHSMFEAWLVGTTTYQFFIFYLFIVLLNELN